MKLSLILLLLYVSYGQSKSDLKIRKCHRADGTIAYQEKTCDTEVGVSKNHFTKKLHANKKIVPRKPTTKNSLSKSKPSPITNRLRSKTKYKKLSKINTNGTQTQVISDQVKSNKISLEVLNRWSMFKKVYNNKLLHMKFLDDSPQSKLSLLIDFTDPQGKSFSHNELIDMSELIGSRYVNGSIEGQVNAELLNVKDGIGAVFLFTNSDLVKDYNYITKGLIYKKNWLIQFTLLTDSIDNYSYKFTINKLLNEIKIHNI